MKINVITMHRIINYGSILQAYALKRELEIVSEGKGKIVFVDYLPEHKPFKHKVIMGIRPFVLKIKKILPQKSEYRQYLTLRNYRFLTEFNRYLEVSNFYNVDYDADLTVIGSDEVFNICQQSMWKGSLFYFGEKVKRGRLCTYAASFGNTTLSKIEADDLSASIRDALKNMNAVSVRDENSKNIITELLPNVLLKRHLDPVLIYSFKNEMVIPKQHDYIVVYGYDNRLCEKTLINNIKAFAKKHSKKLIAIGGYQKWCDHNIVPTPFEVLGYFKFADYIITDTFHGTVMSIKYKKQFATIIRTQNSQKLVDLLRHFDLENRIVDDFYDVETVLETKYDSDKIENLIRCERKHTMDYLREQLEGLIDN